MMPQKIIDAHIHSNFEDGWIKRMAKDSGVKASEEGLKKEMQENNIAMAISMGIKCDGDDLNKAVETPIIADSENKNIIKIGGINPYKPNLEKTEEAIKSGKIKGLKIYLGYYHFYPSDSVYIPFYELAEKYKITVIFHTGDTFLENSLLKYANPINIDEVAIKFRNVNFIISHFGNPWVMETANLLWKNKNVYADLSGLIVGKIENSKKVSGVSILMLKEALKWCDSYDKILYGSDWPFSSLKDQIRFVQSLIPEEYHEKVFSLNAKKLFKI